MIAYEPVPGWGRLPADWSYVDVVGVATDRQDRVYVFNRGAHPMIIFDRSGELLGTWGEGLFNRPHGITIGPDDAIYCTDDRDHTVRKFTPEGKCLLTLGQSGRPSDTGIDGLDYRTIRQAAGPFNLPTNVALAANGDLFITDGYGNSRVHHFTPDGKLLSSWGSPGDRPGQFNLPHGIAIDRLGRIYVADRENSRVQRFTSQGEFIDQWTEMARPMQVLIDPHDHVFVAEVGFRAGLFPWQVPPANPPFASVSVWDLEGRLLGRIGNDGDPCAAGNFFAPHDVCLDSRGDMYVGEVMMAAGGNRGLVPPTCHALQKFARHGTAS